jgi:hypothetical protein
VIDNRSPVSKRRDFLKAALAALAGAGLTTNPLGAFQDGDENAVGHIDAKKVLSAFEKPLPKDAADDFLKAAKMIAEAAKTRPAIRSALAEARSVRLQLDPAKGKEFQEKSKPHEKLDSIEFAKVVGLTPFVAGLYRQSVALINSPKAFTALEENLKNSKELKAKVQKTVSDIPKEFPGDLLLQLQSKANSDNDFLEQLTTAAESAQKLEPDLAKLKALYEPSKEQASLIPGFEPAEPAPADAVEREGTCCPFGWGQAFGGEGNIPTNSPGLIAVGVIFTIFVILVTVLSFL